MKITRNYAGKRAPLYHRYPGQTNPQPAYLCINPRLNEMYVEWDGEIGNAMPMDVWDGRRYRWEINSALTGAAVDQLLADVLPLAERFSAGHTRVWDGSKDRSHLTDDAHEADLEIENRCAGEPDHSDLVQVWSVDQYLLNVTSDVTAETTDEEIARMAADIESDADSDGVLLDGDVTEYLTDQRDVKSNAL